MVISGVVLAAAPPPGSPWVAAVLGVVLVGLVAYLLAVVAGVLPPRPGRRRGRHGGSGVAR